MFARRDKAAHRNCGLGGIAPGKVLAKIANEYAKANEPSGVCSLELEAARWKILQGLPAEEVWGIGRGCAARLRQIGVHTAIQLAKAPIERVRAILGVNGERIHYELNGIKCWPLEPLPEAAQSIQCSRSFSKPLRDLVDLQEAVAAFVARACEKLRAEGSVAGHIDVFIRTSRFNSNAPSYQGYEGADLPMPLADTSALTKVAFELLQKIYRSGFDYKKAGVILADISAATSQTADLFAQADSSRKQALMRALDDLSGQYGRDKVFVGAAGTAAKWKGPAEKSSMAMMNNTSDGPKATIGFVGRA